jgi:hypothetical protein
LETLKELSTWNRHLATAISQLGEDGFFPTLIEAVRQQVTIAYPQIWLYHRDLPPRVLYHEIPPAARKAQIDDYLEGPYREDPFFQTSMNRPATASTACHGMTAGRLEESSYYREYYADTGTVDEAIFPRVSRQRQRASTCP